MRSLTPSDRSLFDRLHKAWIVKDAGEESRLLYEIAELREPTAIPPLVGMLYRQEGRAEAAAASTIQRIVDRCSVFELVQLDQDVRRVYGWSGNAVSPNSVVPVSLSLTGTLGILSFNASGHVREAAMRALSISRNSQSRLLIRLHSWVISEQTIVCEIIIARVECALVREVGLCLPCIFEFEDQSRRLCQSVIQTALIPFFLDHNPGLSRA